MEMFIYENQDVFNYKYFRCVFRDCPTDSVPVLKICIRLGQVVPETFSLLNLINFKRKNAGEYLYVWRK